MGLDLYAGPLWRYYSGKIIRPQERAAREVGIDYQLVYPDHAPKLLAENDAKQAAKRFRSEVGKVFGHRSILAAPLWSEDLSNYHSEQLGYDGLSALVMVAAYIHRAELKRPKHLTALDVDPAYSEAYAKGYYLGPIAILEAHMFVPSNSDQLHFIPEPGRSDLVVTSTENLRYALDSIAQKVWQGDAQPALWAQRGLAPATGQIQQQSPDGSLVTVSISVPEDVVMHNAQYGWAILSGALQFAEANKAMIRHDG